MAEAKKRGRGRPKNTEIVGTAKTASKTKKSYIDPAELMERMQSNVSNALNKQSEESQEE